MAEGIPLQVQCPCRPQYEEEEEYYYPPNDQCRGLQLLAEGYPLFHQCLCQSCGTGEPPLQEYQCQCGRHVHFEDEHPQQDPCRCRQPPTGEDPCRCRQPPTGEDPCHCRQVPVRKGHPPPDQCRGGRLPPFMCGHPPQDQCRGWQPPAREVYPPQDQCRCRQVPSGKGHPSQDQCRGRQLPPGQGQPPQGQCHGQKPTARNPQLCRGGFHLHDGEGQPNGEEQPKQGENGGGKPLVGGHPQRDQNPGPHKSDQGTLVKPNSHCTEEKNGKNGSYDPDKPGASRPVRSICTCISIFLLLAGATILVLWLIYRPHKPRFTVIGSTIYDLNTTFPPFMSTTMQFTIIIKNPNKRVSIYYDKLSAFVSYKNQAITPEAMMPPLHMKKRSTVAVAPVIGGTPVQVSMEVANGLAIDEIYGVMGLKLVITGRLRWKVGAIKTKHYGIYVNCELMLDLKKGCVGPVPLLGSPICSVDI